MNFIAWMRNGAWKEAAIDALMRESRRRRHTHWNVRFMRAIGS